MNAVLSNSIDARNSKPGDPVKAKTAEPVKSGGQVVIPRGATLLGHVTQAQAAGKGEGQSAVGIVFDRAVLKDGHEIPLNTTIRALAAAEGAASATGADSMGSMGGMGRAGSSAGGGLAGGGLVGGAAGGGAGGLGSAVGAAGHVAGGASGAVGSGLGGTREVLTPSPGATGGLDASGMLSSSSHGVFGLRDLSLQHSVVGTAAGSGSVITSAGRNVHLDNGTRMLLSVEGGATSSGTAPAMGAANGSVTGAAQGTASGAANSGASGGSPTPDNKTDKVDRR
jgi:hypothetical protein